MKQLMYLTKCKNILFFALFISSIIAFTYPNVPLVHQGELSEKAGLDGKNLRLLNNAKGRKVMTTSSIFYVATDGSDSNSGISESTPWQTINYAISQVKDIYANGNAPVGGIEIKVKAGNYNNVSIDFTTNNSTPITDDATKPIKLIGYKTLGITPQVNYEAGQDIRTSSFYNEMPLINGLNSDGNVNSTMEFGIDLNRQHYIEVHNFLITDFRQYGVSCSASGKGLVIKNTIVTNIGSAGCVGAPDPETSEPLCGYGISLYGETATIDNCIVTDAGAHNIEVWSDNNSRLGGNLIVDCKSYGTEDVDNTTGYFIAIRNSDNSQIKRCTVERVGNPVHQGHAIGVIGGHNNIIEDCYVKNSREGFYLRGDCMYNIFRNCEVEDPLGKYEAFQIRRTTFLKERCSMSNQ